MKLLPQTLDYLTSGERRRRLNRDLSIAAIFFFFGFLSAVALFVHVAFR